jgi:hypothetical protein
MPQSIDNQWRTCPIHHIKHDRYISCPDCKNNKIPSIVSDSREELRTILEKLDNATIVSETGEYKVSICPICHQKSLYYHKTNKEYSCFNKPPKCTLNSWITILKEKIQKF